MILDGSLEALDLDILHVLVLAVVAEPEESFLELDKLESWEVLRVTTHEDALLFGSNMRSGIPQLCGLFLHESDLKNQHCF